MIGPKHCQIVNLRASGICKPACAICASSGFSERKDKAGFKPLSQNHGRGTSWPARIIHSAMFAPVTPPRATSFTQHAPRHGQQASPRGSRCLPVAALVVPLTWHELGAAQPEEKRKPMGQPFLPSSSELCDGYAMRAERQGRQGQPCTAHSRQVGILAGTERLHVHGRHAFKAWSPAVRVARRAHAHGFLPGRTLTISRPA